MDKHFETNLIARIQQALEAAVREITPFLAGLVKAEYKSGDHVVTGADRLLDRVLRDMLVRDHEGWLSEESADDFTRLKKRRVWIVDPLDGTREFVAGVPEWSISIGLVQDGQPIAGGVCNPATKETFVGSLTEGVRYNGQQCRPSRKSHLVGALILASRSEVEQGEWEQFRQGSFEIKPVGSIAYKLALVAAGFAHATWTLRPKHEWDIAGGVALIRAGGGFVRQLGAPHLTFNNRSLVLPSLLASCPRLAKELTSYLKQVTRSRAVTKRRSTSGAHQGGEGYR